MPLQTDLNAAPYFDDYDPKKDFYRVLFQPGVAVQARELNQLQSILQNQIERFGDNIFRRGTIVQGCNLIFHDALPFVKIKDTETDGTPVNISQYKNLYVKNSSNVSAFIVDTIDGFESRAPDLNTLFVKYNSSGVDSNTSTFSESEVLDVYDPNYPIFKYRIIDGSSGFSNSDSVVIVSSLAIQNSTGGSGFPVGAFNVNQIIQNGVANAVIVEANDTANAEALILKIRPLSTDLQTANTLKWKFTAGETIRNANTANVANVSATIGSSAQASIVTDALGKIVQISPINMGSGYYYQPYVTMSITSGSNITASEITQLDIIPQNYLTSVAVANGAMTPIGTGYGVTVDEGVIYQQGFFSRVEEQFIVVNKYSNTNFTKALGFSTEEQIVDSNQDPSLLDNATGTPNETAPGANRLKLVPKLFVLDKSEADANSEFLPIVEFADGQPYRQNKKTVYNIIGDEMAKRTFEESGNYVLDQFILTTKDSQTFSENSSVFKIHIDPGMAYIRGYRIETSTNYSANVDKGIDTINSPGSTIKVGYGNYIKVKQLGGIFQFNTGDIVTLRSAAANYLTANAGNNITAPGSSIGQARIRSLVLDEGEIGTPTAVYRLYLFDIVMNAGKNFADIKAIHYGGTNPGVCDVVLESGKARLYDTSLLGLLYKPVNAIQYANNITYTYRTIDQSKTANSTGYITITQPAGEFFPYSGNLNTVELRELLVIPLASYQSSANAPGTISTTSGSANVGGSAGANFVNTYKPGDFVKFANSTASIVGQVSQIVNTTLMILTSNATSTITGNSILYFPKNAPISLTNRSTRGANVAANGQMTIYLANSIANTSGSSTSANVAVVYNVTANNVNPATKTSNRGIYTRIIAANNAGGYNGPWALGVSDVYRLRSVHARADTNTQLTTPANSSYIDNDFITLNSENVFANGDSVVYTALNGNTALTGLSNNSSYYVVYANSSGMALSATRNGANINITATVNNNEVHRFTGRPRYFAEDTFGVSDVTNDFYIDNNQREDYLDTSYLYRKPRAGALPGNTVLLVKYDAFTTGTGVKTVSSYSINDSSNLEVLTAGSNINTLEIPEMVGTDGKYYDLRDQIDFRPVSSNTIPLITEVSNTLLVNPSEPSNNTRFSSSEQKFPVPNSTLTANITYYVARNDRVVLDKNGNFVTVKGVPNVLDAFPPEPKDSITLQYLRIPPYPSLPFALSKETVEIIDTKVANEKYGKRKDHFTIVTPIDKDQRARIQVKNYKMSDIANLERRLKDLEYYVSFTLAEAIAKSRFIASSNGNNDRYKFGFFVDPFTDYTYSDVDNPEYWASIKDDQLVPKVTELNFEFFYDTAQNGDDGINSEAFITLPYVEYELIAQNDATDGPIVAANTGANTGSNTIIVTPGNTGGSVNVVTNTVVTTVTQTIATSIGIQKNTNRSDSAPYIYDEFLYTFSATAGPVQLYANHRDNNMAFEISQRTTQNGTWATTITSSSATAVTQSDYNNKGISGLNDGRSYEHLGTINRKSYGPVGGFVEDHQKILWNHDPAKGIYYRIRVYKGKNHGGNGKGGTYGFKLFYPTDTTTTSVVKVTTVKNFGYVGVVHSVSPNSFTLTMSSTSLTNGTYIPQGIYVADSQKFVIEVSGLKPNTYHNFKLGDADETTKCKQIRTSSTTTNTTGLLTDENGKLKFEFYYDAGITEATSDVQQLYKLLSAAASTKIFTLTSVDNASYAAGEILVKFYTTYTAAQLNSFATLNVTNTATKTSDYNYSNIGSILDTTLTNVQQRENTIKRDWIKSQVRGDDLLL